MRVLVTGATGFIGSYLIGGLLDRGHHVVATDIVPTPEALKGIDRLTYMRADLTQAEGVEGLLDESRANCVIHLAALLAEFCEAVPARGYRVNVMGTLSLLDACVAGEVDRLVMASTPAVFGRGLDEPVADDANKVPETVYGQTKLACEHILDWYRHKKALRVSAVHFPWVYGPGRVNGLTAEYSSKLLDAIALGREVIVETPDAVGDWLYVKDAVKALVLLAERKGDTPQVTYNTMGEVHSVAGAMAIAQEVYPEARITIRRNKAFHYPYAASFDDSRARAEIGWSPDYPVRRGIKDHVETIRKRREAA
ncbi:MAG: NAD(P)-dependent oxidoreductase [Litoreibacter sp.]|nr:NAD(P)-dependent oxidoreductase [Litoreibacter sp.]